MKNILKLVTSTFLAILLAGSISTPAIAQAVPLDLDKEIRNATLACLKALEVNRAGVPSLLNQGYKKRGRKKYIKSPHKTVLLNIHPYVVVQTGMNKGQAFCGVSSGLIKKHQALHLFDVLRGTIVRAGYKKVQILDKKGRPKNGYKKGNTKFTIRGTKKYYSGSYSANMWLSRIP